MPPVIPPCVNVIPPASATIIWAIPTNFAAIRCLGWAEGESKWRLAVLFGNDVLKTEVVPDLKTLYGAADLLRRGLAPFNSVSLASPEARRARRRRRRRHAAFVRSCDN